MPYRARVSSWVSAVALAAVSALCAGGCSAGNAPTGEAVGSDDDGGGGGSGRGGNGNGGGSATSGTAGAISLGGNAGTAGTAGSSGTAGTCGTATCTPEGGTYCGQIGDNCGGSLECGVCMGDWTCEMGLCVGGQSCVPTTACSVGSATFCGTIGDGCGRSAECPACPTGQECRGRVCVTPGCLPLTCTMGAYTFCGQIGDGCGGTLDCSTCPAGMTCGGGGLEGVCGATDCPTKVSCNNEQGMQQYCGTIGSGCGGQLECPPTCTTGTCGMETPNVCPGTGGPTCVRLQCDVENCANGGQAATVLTGTVRDPAGTNPIYNALVYVPNEPLPALPDGATCDRCEANAVSVVTSTLTDTTGAFRLTGVPAGANVPVVIQVGKWRRSITVSNVPACAATALPAEQTRLPRTQAEGNIPKIAAVTGGSDALECLLRRIGIAESEFGVNGGNQRVHLYAGGDSGDRLGASHLANGTAFPGAYTTLFSSVPKMLEYDIHMLSCEGSQVEDLKAPVRPNMKAYLDGGGRVFASHLHWDWFEDGPAPFPSTAAYLGSAGPKPEPQDLPMTGIINTNFPKGAALADWLVNVQASTTRGQLTIVEAQQSYTAANPPTQDWITVPMWPTDSMRQNSVQYMTFNTPVEQPAEMQCGRAALTDLHINTTVQHMGVATGGDKSDPGTGTAFPSGCRLDRPMSPQALALEFMFFDLSSCIMRDDQPPRPPDPPPRPGGSAPPPGGAPPPPPPPPVR